MGTIKFFSIAILTATSIYFLILTFEVMRLSRDFELENYKPGRVLLAFNVIFPLFLVGVITIFL